MPSKSASYDARSTLPTVTSRSDIASSLLASSCSTAATLSRRLLVPHETALIMASCKMAVKKGDPLTYEEMTRLLADLARMKNPFTCPHGRPILVRLPFHEMDRKFHRLGPH